LIAGAYLAGTNTRRVRRALKAAFERIKRGREAKRREVEAEAARRALDRWERSKPAYPRHKYLSAKGIEAHGLRQDADKLLVPIYDGETLISVQQIAGDGDKRFTAGSRVEGGSYALGDLAPDIWIGEGFATCATIHELTGSHVVVAFNSKNLLPVARRVREAGPQVNIIISADDDYETSLKPGPCFGINPGIRDAEKAAKTASPWREQRQSPRPQGSSIGMMGVVPRATNPFRGLTSPMNSDG